MSFIELVVVIPYAKYQLPSFNSFREKSNVKVSSARPPGQTTTDQTISHILLRNVRKNVLSYLLFCFAMFTKKKKKKKKKKKVNFDLQMYF